jgi:hypothetical protein
MALAIAGGILGTHLAPAQGHIGDILRKTSAALYGALYLVLFVVHLRCWTDRWEMRSYRRRVRKFLENRVLRLTKTASFSRAFCALYLF